MVICTKLVRKVYLILSNVDDNATPEVFHNGVDVIGLRTDREDPSEKIQLRRFVGEDLTKKIRRRRSDCEDPSEEIRLRRCVGGDSTEKMLRRRSVGRDPTEKVCRRRSD